MWDSADRAEHLCLLGLFVRAYRITPLGTSRHSCPFISGSPRVVFGFHGFVPKVVPTGESMVQNISPCCLQQPPKSNHCCKPSDGKGSARMKQHHLVISPTPHPFFSPLCEAINTGSLISSRLKFLIEIVATFLLVDWESILSGEEFGALWAPRVPNVGTSVCWWPWLSCVYWITHASLSAGRNICFCFLAQLLPNIHINKREHCNIFFQLIESSKYAVVGSENERCVIAETKHLWASPPAIGKKLRVDASGRSDQCQLTL